MTPSAPARAMARTWAGLLTPKPTRDRDRRDGRHVADRGDRPVDGSVVRAPVTPTSETQYRKPPLRAAIGGPPRRAGRRGDEVDDGEPGIPGDRLERPALVRGQVGDDDAARPGRGESAAAAAAPSPPPITWLA